MKHLKGHCQVCGGHLEFPAEGVGTNVECPHCGKVTGLWLATPPEEPTVPRRTIIWTIITVLILLSGLAGAVVALKRAEKQAAAKREAKLAPAPDSAASADQASPLAQPASAAAEALTCSEISLQKTPGSSLVYAVGTLTNNSDGQHFGVKVFIDLFDSADNKIGQATDYQQLLEAKGTWNFKALVMQKKTAQAKLASIKEDQ